MDLAQLADLGEFTGGAGVLVTLVYLALQVRRGTNLSTSTTRFAWGLTNAALFAPLRERGQGL